MLEWLREVVRTRLMESMELIYLQNDYYLKFYGIWKSWFESLVYIGYVGNANVLEEGREGEAEETP